MTMMREWNGDGVDRKRLNYIQIVRWMKTWMMRIDRHEWIENNGLNKLVRDVVQLTRFIIIITNI